MSDFRKFVAVIRVTFTYEFFRTVPYHAKIAPRKRQISPFGILL